MFTLKLLTQQNRHIHHMFVSSKCYSLYCNMILLITIFLHIVVTNSLNINETTTKLKAILNEYEHLRNTRCVNVTNKLENFAENTVKFLEKTRQFGEYLNYYNVSDCDGRGSENIEYRTKHILNGFLISENVPDWHWDEYKATYDKVFPSRAHELSALTAWLDNLKRVAQHNREYLAGKHSYSLHLNLFGDWPITTYMNRSGIYDDPFCTPWKLNHAMLLVGYTQEYWVLLNWWGRQWGEDGYIRIRRGFNRCGVANMATYVEL